MSAFKVGKSVLFQDESCLWSAFQQGDVNAFERIYKTYFPSLLSYGKRLSADQDLVQDLVQDVFVTIWTRRATLQNLDTIKYYLFKILRNRLSKMHQKTTLYGSEGQLSADNDLVSPSIEFLITQQETSNRQHAQLQNAIAQLPDRQHEAIMLAFYHDFSNEQIASIMGINHQSVTNHLNRALGSLRGQLSKLYIIGLLLYQLV